MNLIISKFKDVFLSILPVVILVLILHISLVKFEIVLLIRFLFGSVLIILGLTVFLIGIELGIIPLGDIIGKKLAKSNKISIVLISGIILGFFISIAEPGLIVFANQVSIITNGIISNILILVVVSIGLSLMLSLGFLRIFYSAPLYKILFFLYFIIFLLSLVSSKEFLAISFDASGSTTGILAVPFILSLSLSISKLKKNSKAAEEDSFGLVAIASSGAIIAILLLDIFTNANSFNNKISLHKINESTIFSPFIDTVYIYLKESFFSLIPLLLILICFQKNVFKLNKRELRKIFLGFLYSFIGLFLFLIGVNAGFMDIGIEIGENLIALDNKTIIILIGFILGILTILAEPAVYVLTNQIQEVTSGYIKKKAVLFSLSIGVGFAVSLSIIRILVKEIELWHYLLPGYIIIIILMFITPKLFVGIAFDAGGVATGPMTTTFILAFIQGAAHTFDTADLMIEGFGMIAMVAMIPIIALQILGLVFLRAERKKEKI